MNKNTNSRTATTYNLLSATYESWSTYTWPTVDQAETTVDRMVNINGFSYAQYEVAGLSVFAVTDEQGHVQAVIAIEDDVAAKLHKAVRKAQPVTVTYVKADGEETVRTIEPTSLSLTKAGDVIVKAADRKSGDRRSFRLDRVRTYTIHRTAFTVRMDTSAPGKAELVQAFQAQTERPVRHATQGWTGRTFPSTRAFGPTGWSVKVELDPAFAHLSVSGTVRAREDQLTSA